MEENDTELEIEEEKNPSTARPNNRGRTTEEREQGRWERTEAWKAANKEAMQERMSKARSKNGSARHYQHKNTSGQLEMLMTAMLKQFIDELKGKPLLNCDFTNKEQVARRKDHLTIINNTMSMIRQIRDLKILIEDDEGKAVKEDVMTPENVIMMDEAKVLLKKAGLKEAM